ncbi:MAG: flagellar M-ring protein FliF [Gammaproteobacteria bacterium]|nr:flagellar M-ring protein FliF [Gammaproteobacteria bacterium]
MAEMAPALPDAKNSELVSVKDSSKNAIDTFVESHTVKHFGRLIGLAVAVAIGVVVALWSSEPNYTPLFNNISGKDVGEIAQILQSKDIDFKLDPSSGTLQVEQARSAEARMLLATQGLPQSASVGLEMLEKDQGLGTSQFIETARYNHALESELARSVESIRSVESARVHLALPKQSIFIRNRTKPSASVVTKLYAGRALNKNQVEAIVNMVASSIPMLEAKMVTVVDQFGHLLSVDDDIGMALSTKQFDYTNKIQNNYADRIVKLLEPIIGEGRVNAQVSADLNFSAIETTREAYDPERSVIRSEQISEQEDRAFNAATGIPGALSNQPPGTGTTNAKAGGAEGELPGNQSRTATRNFEVDRVISHTQHSVGKLERLSVAVIIDHKGVLKDDGSVESVAYSDAEVTKFKQLVEQAVGFNQARGDTVSIINSSFVRTEQTIEEMPLWKELLNKGWVVDLLKQVFGAIGLLIVYLMFGKPLLKSLNPNRVLLDEDGNRIDPETGEVLHAGAGSGIDRDNLPEGATVNEDGEIVDTDGNVISEGKLEKMPNLMDDPNNPANLLRQANSTYEQKIEMARNIVMDDPARVSNVLKNWIGED